MVEIIIYYFRYSLFIFLISCNPKNKEEINKVLLCAMDQLMSDIEFRDYLIGGENYLAWVHDGYVVPDSVYTEDGMKAWSKLDFIDFNESFLTVLNSRFPKGHKLKLVSQQENEKILINKKDGQFSCWFFGGMKQDKNRYFLSGGFAV